ncbi:MAG: DnaA/Hda family protein [Asticcacaulis sp.]
MSKQLPLDLTSPSRFETRDYVVSNANADLYALINGYADWINPHLFLVGPEGSGKTHTGHVFARIIGGVFLGPEDKLPESGQYFVVDEAEQFDQEALFHLCNRTASENGRLILLSRTHPLEWRIDVPDLRSRLLAMRIIEMPQPDDDGLKAVLKSRFAVRAITPSDEFLDYLSCRIDRRYSEIQKIVTEIEAYAGGRAFTRALAREYIEKTENLSWLSDGDEI